MLNLMHSRLKRYGVAMLAVLLALLLTQLLWLLHKLTIYPLFLAAVMVSSWYGGFQPGLVATILSALACAYFFIAPLGSLVISGSNIVGLAQFVLVALLICTLNTMLRSAQRQAQRNYQQLQQSQESLRQSEERYRLLVEGVTNYAIFMLDADGCFVSWNIGAGRMLGYQEAEIIGQSFEIIFTPEARARRLPEQVLRTAVSLGFARDNRSAVRKDSTQFWAHCVITALRDDNGNLRGFAKIMQDITERKRAEEEREQLLLREQAARAVSEAALCAAEAANRAKDDFLAVVSHELRTPMTAIVGWAGILLTGMLDEVKMREAIEAIARNANSQLQLIEDLLDISRIVRGELALNFDWVDVLAVIAEALLVVQPTADAKNIQLEFVQVTSVEQIWGDSNRLQQVVLNLLSNAIKFTPNGGRVEIQLSMEMESEHSSSQLSVTNYAQIQVIDTGIGINPDFLPYVFERFWQADSTSTRTNRGLGLGLAITRYLVESHGGTIGAESRGIGQGATFTVKLPLLAASVVS
jgi:PAS domain S-box-containing protein